jgi:ankyrin repeat protein
MEDVSTLPDTVALPPTFMDEVQRGRIGHLQALLDAGGVDINLKSRGGYTYLQHACMSSYDKVVTFLIRNGASLSLENDRGFTALHVAQCCPNTKRSENIIRTLLVHGICVHHMSKCGKIPIHTAVSQGSSSVVKLLLDFGADISDVDFMGQNALHLAAVRTTGSAAVKQKICKILLSHGNNAEFKLDCLLAQTDYDSYDDDSETDEEPMVFTPFDLAFLAENQEIASMLRIAQKDAQQECCDIRRAIIARRQETRRGNELALFMGQHERLGEKSLIKDLPAEVVQMILKHA